jgi:prepilin-type processing-associated H-X9-DG protein
MSGANMVVKQAVVAPTAILGGMLLPAIGRARQEARKVACINNLKQIGTGIAMYRNENNGQMPPSLAELRETVLQSSKVFVCPATDKTKKVNGLKTGYKYVGPLPGEVPPMVIIAYDRKGNHSGGRNCLFRDFHVEFVKNQELRSGEGYESLEQSYEKVMKACGEDLTDERKKELQEFYEIE